MPKPIWLEQQPQQKMVLQQPQQQQKYFLQHFAPIFKAGAIFAPAFWIGCVLEKQMVALNKYLMV